MTLAVETFAAIGRALWRRSDIPMAQVSDGGTFLDVNPAACRLWNRSREDLLRSRWQDITDPEYLDVDAEQVSHILEGDALNYTLDKVYVRPDGSKRRCRLHVVRVDPSLGAGPHRWLLAVIQDQTDLLNRAEDLTRRIAALEADNRDQKALNAMLARGLTDHPGDGHGR